ncbi:hypothetical protein IMCC3317_13800 [Kordia antarctica]|uniref:Uncharacterized protein n=1 Tax=Kordia antarctica TaxID=1218801 RepID=A0A7L4ZHT2_9FLAO|nr:hypothetical protein [Kordia antarctica]QHI36027.1 hypothetical protein IMCC3317_13800 [Kordia antarctica]
MKEKDNIENLFDRLKDDFDVETPEINHQNRFLSKLEAQQQTEETNTTEKPIILFTWWKHIAAACVILLSLGIFIGSNFGASAESTQVTFSPEVEKSQLYFASLIENELIKVKAAETEDTKEIVQDGLVQLKRLENDYTNLKNQLIERGNDKRILRAMVTNFQLRINLLESVLTQIDELKLFKNENTII